MASGRSCGLPHQAHALHPGGAATSGMCTAAASIAGAHAGGSGLVPELLHHLAPNTWQPPLCSPLLLTLSESWCLGMKPVSTLPALNSSFSRIRQWKGAVVGTPCTTISCGSQGGVGGLGAGGEVARRRRPWAAPAPSPAA